jgi:hypothetical protein
VLTLDAMPVDVWAHARIEPAISMQVRQLSNEGVEASCDEPLMPGRRVSLSFPDSPFLPRPGTLARVSECVPTDGGYRLHLAYEPHYAA